MEIETVFSNQRRSPGTFRPQLPGEQAGEDSARGSRGGLGLVVVERGKASVTPAPTRLLGLLCPGEACQSPACSRLS